MPPPIAPLPYHRAVADILERENPASFRSLLPGGTHPAASELDQSLLRSTYRLEEAAHPEVHSAVRAAASALGITVPLEVYADEGRHDANAELVFVPERVILLFTGPALDLLTTDELRAVAGHELAHHLLWTLDGGRHLAATRLLDAAEGDARTPAAYLETARRLRLATELFADRAGLWCSQDLAVTVAGLVKVATGLRQVDAAAYLRQAAEVDRSRASTGTTHPETVLRAWALQQWSEAGLAEEPVEETEARIAAAYAPPVDLAALDLPAQDDLVRLTRALVGAVVSVPAMQTTGVLALAGQYAVDVPEFPVDPATALPGRLPAETRKYLATVLTDLATADEDATLDALAQVLGLARRCGLEREYVALVGDELGLGDAERTRLGARADALAGGAE